MKSRGRVTSIEFKRQINHGTMELKFQIENEIDWTPITLFTTNQLEFSENVKQGNFIKVEYSENPNNRQYTNFNYYIRSISFPKFKAVVNIEETDGSFLLYRDIDAKIQNNSLKLYCDTTQGDFKEDVMCNPYFSDFDYERPDHNFERLENYCLKIIVSKQKTYIYKNVEIFILEKKIFIKKLKQ